jgi:lipoprotein-anchoring transpeptidase ErfK/SrfK
LSYLGTRTWQIPVEILCATAFLGTHIRDLPAFGLTIVIRRFPPLEMWEQFMAGMCRSVLIVWSVAATLTAMLGVTAGVSRADDVDLPGVSLTSTSGAPLQAGGTYGIGEVVVAHFDAPVGDRGAAEQQLTVSTSPPVSGAWHWVDDQTAHWRPPQYYEPGTVVTIIPGQQPPLMITIGASHVSIADDATKQVSVYDGGKLARTMPTSMGRGGTDKVGNKTLSFWTQPCVYTVMDKSNPVVMDSSTYGLPINSHLGYKESIPYAVRISTDGIYMHELDATVWAQGNTDTSHGCLNLNHDNAVWFYNFSVPGDVVEVRNTGGQPLQLWQNGDWSVPWDEWAAV